MSKYHTPGQGQNGLRPQEPQCPVRGLLTPDAQCRPPSLSRENSAQYHQADIKIAASAEDPDAIGQDIAKVLQEYGPEWLARGWNFSEVLKALEQEKREPVMAGMPRGAKLWLEAGREGSPLRDEAIALCIKALAG